MRGLSALLWRVAGVIQRRPLSGALDGKRLSALYPLPLDKPKLQLLMRQCTVLFGLLIAAVLPDLRSLARGAGLADGVALACLLPAPARHLRQQA